MLFRSVSVVTLLALSLSAVSAQETGADNPRNRLKRSFERKAPKVGSRVPDVTLFDSKGKPVPLRSLKEHYTVLVFGCLT